MRAECTPASLLACANTMAFSNRTLFYFMLRHSYNSRDLYYFMICQRYGVVQGCSACSCTCILVMNLLMTSPVNTMKLFYTTRYSNSLLCIHSPPKKLTCHPSFSFSIMNRRSSSRNNEHRSSLTSSMPPRSSMNITDNGSTVSNKLITLLLRNSSQ